MSTPAVELRHVWFSYGGPVVLEDVSLTVRDGEFLGVVGPNAGGKSTLLKVMLGLLRPQRGEVRVLGRAPVAARRAVGYVPQHPRFPPDFPISVQETVLTGRLGRTRLIGPYTRRDRDIARRVMAEMEVADLAARQLGTLSGGQLQRVLVARALACEPRLLILDEPTANIDMRVETEIFELLRQLNRRMTIIVVSHDIAFISAYVGRVACLNRTLAVHDTAHIDGPLIDALYGSHVHAVEHEHP